MKRILPKVCQFDMTVTDFDGRYISMLCGAPATHVHKVAAGDWSRVPWIRQTRTHGNGTSDMRYYFCADHVPTPGINGRTYRFRTV